MNIKHSGRPTLTVMEELRGSEEPADKNNNKGLK